MKSKYIISLIVIVSIISPSISQENKTCKSALDCQESLCCVEEKCVDNDDCQVHKLKVYIAAGVLGGLFIIASLVYMYFVIKESKANVAKSRNDLKSLSEIKVQADNPNRSQNDIVVNNNQNVGSVKRNSMNS